VLSPLIEKQRQREEASAGQQNFQHQVRAQPLPVATQRLQVIHDSLHVRLQLVSVRLSLISRTGRREIDMVEEKSGRGERMVATGADAAIG
jgi:hypothetical protein